MGSKTETEFYRSGSTSLMESDHTQQAIEVFGTTYYKTRAGFMLKDGRMLDLSDEGGYRDDHRVIAQAMEDEDFESNSDYLIAFMNEGNIRLIPELPGVDIVEEPTEAQYKSLKDYIQFWVTKERHFEVQFSDTRGCQKDWKEYNGYTPVIEILSDIKQQFNPEELEESFLVDDYAVPDLIGAKYLYHATYKPYWEEIKKSGRIKPGAHSSCEGLSHSDVIYLLRDYDNAYSYAETAEDVPEEYLDQIVVLTIDANKLNIDKLNIDENQAYGNYKEVDVEDPSTWIELQYEGYIPTSWITEVSGELEESKHLTEMYPHKGERQKDFLSRFMREMGDEFPNTKQRYAVAHSYWNRSRKDNSLRESILRPATPYLLRNDGALIPCQGYHPYICNVYDEWADVESLVNERIEELKFFYDHSQVANTRDYIRTIVKSANALGLVHLPLLEDVEKAFDIHIDTHQCIDQKELRSFVRWVGAELDQEFCRVRTSDNKQGGTSRDIYFQISSIGFNWFPLIWKLVHTNRNWITSVTISRDTEARNFKLGDIYRVGGHAIDHVDSAEFLCIKGNPIVETFKCGDSLLERAFTKLLGGSPLQEIYADQHPRNLIGFYKGQLREELVFDLNNILQPLQESLEGPDIFDLTAKGESSEFRELLRSEEARKAQNVELEIQHLTPIEYFEGCAKIFGNSSENQLRQVKYDKSIINHLMGVLNRGEKFPLTYLNYANKSQEGRHRMCAAGELYGWDKKYPVAVFTVADEDTERRRIQEAEEERIWKLIDGVIQRAWKFSYRSIEELREELIYLLSNDIKDIDSKLTIVESNRDLIIKVDGVEYFIEKNSFNWIPAHSTTESDLKIDDPDDFSIEELEAEMRKAGLQL